MERERERKRKNSIEGRSVYIGREDDVEKQSWGEREGERKD